MINPRAAFPLFPFKIIAFSFFSFPGVLSFSLPVVRGALIQSRLPRGPRVLGISTRLRSRPADTRSRTAYLELRPRPSDAAGLLRVLEIWIIKVISLKYSCVIVTARAQACRSDTVEEGDESERGTYPQSKSSSPSSSPLPSLSTNLCPAPIERRDLPLP